MIWLTFNIYSISEIILSEKQHTQFPHMYISVEPQCLPTQNLRNGNDTTTRFLENCQNPKNEQRKFVCRLFWNESAREIMTEKRRWPKFLGTIALRRCFFIQLCLNTRNIRKPRQQNAGMPRVQWCFIFLVILGLHLHDYFIESGR